MATINRLSPPERFSYWCDTYGVEIRIDGMTKAQSEEALLRFLAAVRAGKVEVDV